MSLRSGGQISRHPKTTFAGQLVCPHCHDNSIVIEVIP